MKIIMAHEIDRKFIQTERWRKADSVSLFKQQIVLARYPIPRFIHVRMTTKRIDCIALQR